MNAQSLGLVLACSCLCGCGVFQMQHVASQHAPADLRCPSADVAQMHHGSRLATQPAFHGCGRYVVYHCMSLVSDARETECAPVAMGDE